MAKIVCGAFVEGGKVLLVRRASHRKWSPNCWDLVGGHVEKGEALDVAIVRECKEEVGLMPLALEHVTILFEDEKPKTPFHVFTIRRWEGGHPRSSELSILNWVGSRRAKSVMSSLHCQLTGPSSCKSWLSYSVELPGETRVGSCQARPVACGFRWICRVEASWVGFCSVGFPTEMGR